MTVGHKTEHFKKENPKCWNWEERAGTGAQRVQPPLEMPPSYISKQTQALTTLVQLQLPSSGARNCMVDLDGAPGSHGSSLREANEHMEDVFLSLSLLPSP